MDTDELARALESADPVSRAYLEGMLRGAALEAPDPSQVVTILTRSEPFEVPSGGWFSVPMDTFHGGDLSLVTEDRQYLLGGHGPFMFGLNVRLSSNADGQGLVRFVRDIGGAAPDDTGTQDWVATPGKDFITHTWFFHPTPNKPVGFQIQQNSGKTLVVEYAQLKCIPL
ncbi:MAG: hypothetical protein ABR616_19215 [Dermatophilaceae bacterium]